MEDERIFQKIIEQFPQLDDTRLLREIKSVAKIMHVKEGDILIDYGDYIKFVPLVVDGLIKVLRLNEDEKEILLYFLSGGDTCAASFSCCLTKKRSEIQTIAEMETTLLAIPLEYADLWMEKYSAWRNFIFEMYDFKIYQLIDTIDRLAFSNLDEKLLDYLHARERHVQSKTLHITHSEIAQDLNVSREAVSRMLKKMEHKGMIEIERNRVILKE